MEGTWSEYVDLISTSSLDLHPGNHGANFTNQFVAPQHLPENAYCCLEEIEYTHCFYNVTQHKASVTVFDLLIEHPVGSEQNPFDYPIYGDFVKANLNEGYYDTAEKLCQALNDSLKSCGVKQLENHNVFSYDPISMKFSIDVEGLWITLWLRGDILHYLGVETTQASWKQYILFGKSKEAETFEYEAPGNAKELRHFTNPTFTWTVSLPTKIRCKHVAQLTIVNSFVVYVDCISSQVVGNSYSDALRIVAIKGNDKPGMRIITEFDKVYALKVNKRYISSISVQIKDVYGRDIQFLMGNVRIKLRFTTQT